MEILFVLQSDFQISMEKLKIVFNNIILLVHSPVMDGRRDVWREVKFFTDTIKKKTKNDVWIEICITLQTMLCYSLNIFRDIIRYSIHIFVHLNFP